MILNHIDIIDFKNIAEASLDFSAGVNCLLGMNGMGKSNLLEAIHFLSFARPASSMPDAALIRHGCSQLMVKGLYTADGGSSETVAIGMAAGKGKSIRLNGKEYQRLSEHIGRFPIVTVSPADSRLVEGSGEERRRLMDMVISQADASYLALLIRYSKALDSRNRMLRSGMRDPLLFESVEQTMAEAASAIYNARLEWTREVSPVFASYYSRVSGDAEKASLAYRSQLREASLPELLKAAREKDSVLGHTTVGIHRDDLEMKLDGYSARRLGSQGQVKTFTIALRLAIFDFLRRRRGIVPMLLLDDIFDKLDAERVARIMQLVSTKGEFGQIFITDTNRKHLDEILESIGAERLLLEVNDGRFTRINT